MTKRVKLTECCCKKVGAHISAAGGVFKTFDNNLAVDGRSFACFLKSQRKWTSPPLKKEDIEKFNEKALQLSFDKNLILPHGSYLINLGSADEELRNKSFDNLVDDLRRCRDLGIQLYNFHPGSTAGKCSAEESIDFISGCINKAHNTVENVVIVLETMAGQGNVIGSKFEELNKIIERVENKGRIGVCIDTCHIFAAGYDIRTKEAYERTMSKFDEIVGFKFLRGVHLNDSKCDLASGKDRHENIGKGKIGIDAFKFIMNDPRFDNIPMVLETPASEKEANDVYKQEIKLLYDLVD